MKHNITRFIALAVVMLIMMGALISKLGGITLAEGSDMSEKATDRMLRDIAVKGKRGRILDRNGIVLAYSKTSYNVEFFRDADKREDYDSAIYTESLIKAIAIIEAGGGKTIDTSYIRMDPNGALYFDWGVTSDDAIMSRYKNYCDALGFKIKDVNITKPQSEWDISKWPTAEYCYLRLRDLWYIPDEMPYQEAIKLISIRQEVALNNYRAYEPITIAYDVSLDVVAEINMHSDELVGLQTAQSTTRVYPRGMTAAHIVGYLSRNATKEMVEQQGYAYSDFIGMSGIEASMEQYLTAATTEHQGERVVEVNKNGSIIREISSKPATDGDDVMLAMDYQLQVVTEKALETLIGKISNEVQGGLLAKNENGKYSKAYGGDMSKIKTAKTGAIVVMDVNTGQVLAMASYPSFDPNWFIQGLSTQQSKELFESDMAAATTPMRNKAISAKLAPGSIFKMVTGVAGVVEGVIGLEERVDDKYFYYIMNADGEKTEKNAPHCWNRNSSEHSQQNLSDAIKNSCNYYFCEVAYRLGIKSLNEWAGKFGLTDPTGIELGGEATGIVGGQTVMFDNNLKDEDGELSITKQKTSLPGLIYSNLCEKLKQYLAFRSMEIDEEAVKTCALHLMELQDGSMDNKGPIVRRILADELELPEGVTLVQPWVREITSLLSEIQWKPTYTIRSGYGQGVSLVTPVAVARYVSAIANEGTVYDAHIVNRIIAPDGTIVKQVEPSVFNTLDEVSPQVWDAVKTGLKGVVSPEDFGTASKAFTKAFYDKYKDKLSGKTGTAQVGASTIDIENTSWFVTFTPRENAEIAIVVCVPNGYSGTSSASAVEEILKYYFEKQESAAPENLVHINAIAP
ncbi:MAG: penicillin-binding transpeptidase domain-containing protein [Clostridia bacterium]